MYSRMLYASGTIRIWAKTAEQIELSNGAEARDIFEDVLCALDDYDLG